MSDHSFEEELKQLEGLRASGALTGEEDAPDKARTLQDSHPLFVAMLIKVMTCLPNLVRLMHDMPWDCIANLFTTSEFDNDK